MSVMTSERFLALVAAYGADARRWPEAERAAARAFAATEPDADPVSVEDILRTLFHQMGIDSSKMYNTPLGRPVPIVSGGRVIRDLVG